MLFVCTRVVQKLCFAFRGIQAAGEAVELFSGAKHGSEGEMICARMGAAAEVSSEGIRHAATDAAPRQGGSTKDEMVRTEGDQAPAEKCWIRLR